jgi:hypothetical protein
MKKLISILTVMLVAVVLLSACKKDGEDARDKFVGTYTTNYTVAYGGADPGVPKNYDLTISKSSLTTISVTLGNISDSGQSITATVVDKAIAITGQMINGKTFTGAGNLTDNKLIFTLTSTTGETTEVQVHTATKK